jgi:hypothetical protein
MHYFPQIVAKTTCVGNSLSTFNMSLTSLDTNLYALSTYAHNSVNYLSSRFIQLSATAHSEIASVSANTITFTRSNLTQAGNGIISYDFALNGPHAKVTLTTNGFMNNITNLADGQFGKLLVKNSQTSGYSITGWGNNWLFYPGNSTQSVSANGHNIVDFYYSSPYILGNVTKF